MKKNLKKVISAVIAFALSASAFASVSFAKSFTDVASTASYAEAVDVLSGLGIINGYEDGTFGPDKTITRAEAAKMIVAMVNKIATAEGRKGATQFDDVAVDHWAAGFINVGVSDKFINGKSATTFDPEGQVKYNEIVKMIVSCLGYEEYAQFYGGYPTGYVAIADAEGITKGCSMDGEAAATRGVVAQLIYNALKTPIIQSKGMQYSAAQGGFVPNIEKQDGEESAYFKSLLTEKFDAYFVEGTVTATKKTDSALKADEVIFTVSKGENYDQEYLYDADDGFAKDYKMTALVGDTAAADYINTYANAIAQYTEDDEWILISFVPSGKNKVATLDLALLDGEEHDDKNINETILASSNPYIKVFASEDASKSSKYKLEVYNNDPEDPNMHLFVNGVDVGFTKDNIEKYIIDNFVGVMELTDTYKSNDGYDVISVDYYATAKVKSATSKKIYLESGIINGGDITSAIDLDTETNEELVYAIYYNDEEIAITDVKAEDILSIKYNVKAKGPEDCFYEIYVSRDTAEGKFSGLDTEDELATIGGEKYAFVKYLGGQDDVFKKENMGNDYKVYLDSFGRIFESESVASTVRYAILDKTATSSSWDNDGVRLYLADGTYKTYELDSKCDFTKVAQINEMIGEKDENGDIKRENDEMVKKPVHERVVQYKISTTSGRITDLVFPYERLSKKVKDEDMEKDVDEQVYENYEEGDYLKYNAKGEFLEKPDKVYSYKFTGLGDTAEFKSLTKGIGAIRMNATTKIVDATEYAVEDKISDLAVTTVDKLSAGVEYTAYGYGDKSQNAYPFVLITAGASAYTEDTAFAVVASNMSSSSKDDGTEGFEVTLLYEGEEKSFFITDEAADSIDDLEKGQVIVFQTDLNGDIEEFNIIFNPVLGKDSSGYTDFLANSLTSVYDKFISLPKSAKYWTTKWDDQEKDNNVALLYGPVTKTGSGYFQIAQIDDNAQTKLDSEVKFNGTTDKVGGTKDIYVTSETNVYVFDYTKAKSQQFKADATDADIIETFLPVIDDSGAYDIVTWDSETTEKNPVNFAFTKVVDGTATDVFVILGNDK